MKQKLNINYQINADNMVSFLPGEEVGKFKLSDQAFEPNTFSKELKKTILLFEDNDQTQQIFKMKDKNFILEVEFYGDVEYYISNKIEDLL